MIDIQEFWWKLLSLIFYRRNKKTSKEACSFIKKHQKNLIEEFASMVEGFSKDAGIFTIFMAGSPGAGKTEFSKAFLCSTKLDDVLVRIDPDEIREYLPQDIYKGKNSHIVQEASSLGVNKLLDHCFKKHKCFMLDTTLGDSVMAFRNIKRAIKRGRKVDIFFIYQDPEKAWEFTQAREWKEGRRVTKKLFVHKYFTAIKTTNEIKAYFKSEIELHLIIKNIDNKKIQKTYFNIGSLDPYIKNRYNKKKLLDKLRYMPKA